MWPDVFRFGRISVPQADFPSGDVGATIPPDRRPRANWSRKHPCSSKPEPRASISQGDSGRPFLQTSGGAQATAPSILSGCSLELTPNRSQEGISLFTDFLHFDGPRRRHGRCKVNATCDMGFKLPQDAQQVFHIKPHADMPIGPIAFEPQEHTAYNTTLYLRNNLTTLHPVRLNGVGGSGRRVSRV